MQNKRTKRQEAIRRRRIFLSVCAAILLVSILIISFAVSAIIKVVNKNDSPANNNSSQTSQTSSAPKEPYITGSATVVNTGDILVHSTVLDGAKTKDGGYDFESFFKSAKKYFNAADLSVINLEVTLGGKESGAFSGYPVFNTPDSLADTIKSAGLNFVLTANNHSYDTGLFGLKRTAQVLKEKGIDFIGTKETESDPTYTVKDVNGVKLGIINYTYETTCNTAGRKALNGNILKPEANNLINSFSYQRIDSFYSEAENVIKAMKNDGADAIVFYMHWGNEYQLSPNTWQKSIAQKLCDLGVDVIVGGHPHVLQPMEVIYSQDSENSTVCIYSTGNAISNQRKEIMDSCPSGHTEDGVLFYYTFDKYSNGDVVLSSVDLVPIWVDKYKGGAQYQYQMYPLESENDGEAKYGLTGTAATKAKASYNRTKALMEAGLLEVQRHLGSTERFAVPSENKK